MVPLYFLHRKRFYDWFGNKALQATIEATKDKPKEKWRHVLKKMCKLGVVDHEYIRDTCDMSWVTEDCFISETNRYIQRYTSQMITNTNTVSSPHWKYEYSIGQTIIRHLEESFKKWEDRIKIREK